MQKWESNPMKELFREEVWKPLRGIYVSLKSLDVG